MELYTWSYRENVEMVMGSFGVLYGYTSEEKFKKLYGAMTNLLEFVDTT